MYNLYLHTCLHIMCNKNKLIYEKFIKITIQNVEQCVTLSSPFLPNESA